MAMIWVDGAEVKTPSAFSWGLEDILDSASGRTQDAVMHNNRVAQKRKLSVSWSAPTPEETSAILKAFNPEYVNVRYPDALSGEYETRTFYVGDKSSPLKIWTIGNKRYESISFDLTER